MSRCSKTKMLFDYLVGASQHRRRKVEADRPRGLEIYHQFEPGWLLDRKITRVCAAHDLVNIGFGASPQIGTAGPIAREMTFGIAVFHLEMTPLDIAEVAHSEQKLTAQVCFYRVGRQSSLEVTQLEDFRLLRMRSDRQTDQCGAEQRDEIASSHGSSRQPRDGPSARPECCRSSGACRRPRALRKG